MFAHTATRGLLYPISVAVLISLVSLAACSAPPTSGAQPSPAATAAAATPTAAPASIAPRFEPADCKFRPAVADKIQCGYLIVPEDRSQPSSPTIRLHVAIVKSFDEHPAADPVIYLHGGAGSGALDGISEIVRLFRNIKGSRDLIVFDQRGAGYSQPSLHCPEVDQLNYEELATLPSRTDHETRMLQAYRACRDRLRSQGVNLDAYNSAASAADVNDLRLALGYDKVNLYSISYGTRLALTVMRDFPSNVRSVILDSTVPLDVDLEAVWSPNAERSFNLSFDRCGEDAGCSAAFPNLKATFFALVARLDAQPVQVEITNSANGKRYPLLMDGDRLIIYLFKMLYWTTALPVLPKMISEMSRGDYALFSDGAGSVAFQWERTSEGKGACLYCVEETPFSSPQAIESALARVHPRLREASADVIGSDLALCDLWGVKAAGPVENEPVVSSLPTFVLAGEFDPVTPPAMGKQALATLSQAYYYESRNTGHGVLGGGGFCPQDMATRFLNDPTESPVYDCQPLTFFFRVP